MCSAGYMKALKMPLTFHFVKESLALIFKSSVALLWLCLLCHIIALNNQYSMKNSLTYFEVKGFNGLGMVPSFPGASRLSHVHLFMFVHLFGLYQRLGQRNVGPTACWSYKAQWNLDSGNYHSCLHGKDRQKVNRYALTTEVSVKWLTEWFVDCYVLIRTAG